MLFMTNLKQKNNLRRLIDDEARMMLSNEGYSLYQSMLLGLNHHCSFDIDLKIYNVTPKEWFEAFNYAAGVVP